MNSVKLQDIEQTVICCLSIQYLQIQYFDCIKKYKYEGVNLTKVVKNLYSENYDIEEDANKWKIYLAHGLKGLLLLKCPCT